MNNMNQHFGNDMGQYHNQQLGDCLADQVLNFSNHQIFGNINDKCCCFNLRKVTRAVTQFFDHKLEPVGIRSTQYTLLIALCATSSKTLTEIAEKLVMDRTTLTRNVRPLEKLGLISSVAKSSDKRSKGYTLTEKGQEVVTQAIPLWEQAQQDLVNRISDERFANFMQELCVVLDKTQDAFSGVKK